MGWVISSFAKNPWIPLQKPRRNLSQQSGVTVSRTRLRTRFLLSMVLITTGLTAMSLLVVRHSVQRHVREGIIQDLRNSVTTFQNFQHDREVMLTRSAELVADLPIMRSIMTPHDPATIQDASRDVWQLTGSDLLVLADRDGTVVAHHTKSPGLTREASQQYFERSLKEEDSSHWWFGAHHLYQTFIQPVYFGSRTNGSLLGFLVIGYQIDDRLAREISKVSASQVAFSYGDEIVATTLTPTQSHSPTVIELAGGSSQSEPRNVQIGTRILWRLLSTFRPTRNAGAIDRARVVRSSREIPR